MTNALGGFMKIIGLLGTALIFKRIKAEASHSNYIAQFAGVFTVVPPDADDLRADRTEVLQSTRHDFALTLREKEEDRSIDDSD